MSGPLIPATCVKCGGSVLLEVLLPARKLDEGGSVHICVGTAEGAARLAEIADFRRTCAEAAERRERERLR